jgi:hypothetical protein
MRMADRFLCEFGILTREDGGGYAAGLMIDGRLEHQSGWFAEKAKAEEIMQKWIAKGLEIGGTPTDPS